MFDVCFFIFRTLEPSAFAGFRGSSCCIFRAFGVSGFWFSWVSGFWPSGFRVYACFPACQLSGFLPFMFSSFRLSFFDLSPELSIVCSKSAFVGCGSLLFGVLGVFFPEIPNNRFYLCNNRFYTCNNHFFSCQRPFSKLLRLCLFLLMLVQRCFDFADSGRNPKRKRLLGCLCVGHSGLV